MRIIVVGFQFFTSKRKKKKKREMEHEFSIKMHFTNPKWLTKHANFFYYLFLAKYIIVTW